MGPVDDDGWPWIPDEEAPPPDRWDDRAWPVPVVVVWSPLFNDPTARRDTYASCPRTAGVVCDEDFGWAGRAAYAAVP